MLNNRLVLITYLKTKFLEIKEQYYTHEVIYTDGSKDEEKVA